MRVALDDHGALRAGAGVETELRATGDLAALDAHVVGGLEGDAVAVVVAHDAVLDDGAVGAEQEDAAAAAAAQLGVVVAALVDGEALDAGAAHVVGADHGVGGGRLRAALDEVI